VDEHSLGRLQLVTSRYHELQGLRSLAVMTAALLAFLSHPYFRSLRYAGPVEAALGLLGTVLPFVMVTAMHPLLNRYYHRRFGRVAPDVRQQAMRAITATVLLGAAVFDFRNAGSVRPSAVLIAGALFALATVLRDWPFRAYYSIPLLTCGAAAWLGATSMPWAAATPTEALRFNVSILLAGNLLPAYFDHRLLLSALPLNPAAGQEPAAEVTSSGDAGTI
jgi:hypothetical protein